ncbi:MAG: ABC transporter ATP-binding protein [[Eubacterium] brachy]|nr:ABC transporter ATP-binding protein [[Eubacterium] brachy]
MKEKKRSIGDIVAYSDTKKGGLIAGIFFVCIGTILSIFPIVAIYHIIKILLSTNSSDTIIITYSLYGIIAVIMAYIFTYTGSILCHKFSYKLITDLKKKIVSHIGSLPLGFFTGNSKAKIRQILGSDMNQIEGYFSHQLPNLVSTLVLILVMLIYMFKMNIILAFVTLGTVAIGLAIQVAIMVRIVKSGGLNENFKILDNINSATSEYVKGMPEVKIFGNANKSFKNFESAANKYRNFTSSMTAKIRPGFVSFRVFILSVATFIVPMGIYLIVKNHNDIDIITTFILFLIAAPAISVPCLKLRDFAEGMNLLEEVIQRVWDIIVEKEIVEGEYSAELKNYDIEFEDVGFAYEKDQVLKNINFKAKQGEVTALVGPSGAGKSTIGVLIPRFYEPTDGTIKIGGIDIKEMTFNYLMENISFVFQDNDLISDTIFNNIAMAKKDCKKEDVIEASKKARCHDFIMNLEEGYETILGKGVYLSGGEKQRIAVARAILKDAPVLILDEATSYADAENEYLTQKALSELVKNKTVIMIAHRLGTIKNAHQILVVSDGNIVEKGTHESLIEANGVYNRMFDVFDKANVWKMNKERGLA